MKCLNCNNEVNDNSKFCEFCGTKIENTGPLNPMNQQPVMTSNVISDFKTLDGVINLFKSVNCFGQDNCIIVTFKDMNVHTTRTGVMTGAFGILGSAASSIAEDIERSDKDNMINNSLGIDDFDGLILNKTESGLGIIPLINQGSKLITKLDNYVPNINKFVFVNNNYIESINVKKLTMFSSKCQRLTIRIQGGVEFNLTANMTEKQIPYQSEYMTKFVNMYGGK